MGKPRRYRKKLAKAAAANGEEEEPRQTDYSELAEELWRLNEDDGNASVRSVMKSVKSGGSGGDPLKLKKDAKRCLRRAFLLNRLERTQNSLKKKGKKTSNKNNGDDDDEINESNQKVLNWPAGNSNDAGLHRVPPKKHRKGCQKKQNAQLIKDLALFSKKIKKQLKRPVQNVNGV